MSNLVRKPDVKLIAGVPGVPAQEAVYSVVYRPVVGRIIFGGSNGWPIGAEFPDLSGGSSPIFVPIVKPISMAISLQSGAASGDASDGGSTSPNVTMSLLHWRISAYYTMTDQGYRPVIMWWDGSTYEKVSP